MMTLVRRRTFALLRAAAVAFTRGRALLLACLLLLPLLPARGEPVPPAEELRLTRGEIIVSSRQLPGKAVPEHTARGVVDAPPEAVWEVVDRCGDYARFMPLVQASRELERQGERVVCRIEIDLPFPLPNLWSVTEATHVALPGRLFARRWHMRAGSYTVNDGAWEVAPWGEGGQRSLVTYRIQVMPDMVLPDALMGSLQKSSLPDVIQALRKRVARAMPR